MIDKIYIMYEHGSCVFEKIYYTRINAMTDSQLFTGFISAIGSFAAEALGSRFQSIHLQTGEQLALMKHESGIVGICIADGRDHNKLLSSLLKKILDRFFEIYKKEIEIEDASLIGKTKNFGKQVESIIKNKSSSRTDLKMILGIGLGFLILGSLFLFVLNHSVLRELPIPLFFALLTNPLMMIIFDFVGESIGAIMALIMFFVAVLFLPSSFIAGFLGGNRTKGLAAGLIITVGTYFILLISSVQLKNNLGLDLKGWILSFSPLIFFLTLSVAFSAGYVAERLRLNTFPEHEKEEGRIEKVLKSVSEKIGKKMGFLKRNKQ